MRRSIIVTCLFAATLAGCGRTLVKETVVERPVAAPAPAVVAAPAPATTVIEQPVVTREAIVTAPASCTLGTAAYSSGTLSCQAGFQYMCSNGVWQRSGVC